MDTRHYLSASLALSCLLVGCSRSSGGGGSSQAAVAPSTSAPVTSAVAPVISGQATGKVAVGATMQVPRGLHTATLLDDGRVLIVGGLDGAKATNGGSLITENEIYDAKAATFTKVSDKSLGGNPGGYMTVKNSQGNAMAIGRTLHTATRLLDGRVLICGGLGIEVVPAAGLKPSASEMKTAYIFDPKTSSFAATGSLNTARREHGAVLLGAGQVLIAGGYSSALNQGAGGTLQSAELYDPSTGTFTPLSRTGLDLATPRQLFGIGASSNGAVLVGGVELLPGTNPQQVSPAIATGAEAFNAVQGVFGSCPKPASDRVDATLTETAAGFILAGGEGGQSLVTSVEKLDANLIGWSSAGTLQQARMHHSAAFDGRGVLLVGGTAFNASNGLLTLASAELVDLTTGTTSRYTLAHQRNSATSTQLMDGSILIAGGYEGGTTDPLGLDGTAVGPSEVFTITGMKGPTLRTAPSGSAPATPAATSKAPIVSVLAGDTKSFTDSKGVTWSADTGFKGGVGRSNSHAVTNASDQAVYQHERNGNFTYSFSVPNGTYDVTLKFDEFYWGGANKRLFNVTLNQAQVLQNFDIYAAAGGKYAAIDKTFTVTVTNGQVEIQFDTLKDNAKISAIQITPH